MADIDSAVEDVLLILGANAANELKVELRGLYVTPGYEYNVVRRTSPTRVIAVATGTAKALLQLGATA
jgi:hypothetical protein